MRLTHRNYVKLPLNENKIDTRNNSLILNLPNDILVHLEYLENWGKTEIVTFKKERGDVFSE